MSIDVVFDCDTGIDDAVALLYLAGLHHLGEIRLQAVTTTAGNGDAEQCAWNTKFLLDLVGLADIPVACGSKNPIALALTTTPETHGPTGLGYVTVGEQEIRYDWQQLWHEYLKDDTCLIVTGPATNLATWLRSHPWPKHITLMGGSYLYPGNTTPTAEWNSWVDPHAAKEVFDAALQRHPITVCSLGVTEQFLLTPPELSSLVEFIGEHPVAQVLIDALRFYFEFHEQQQEGYQAQIHDLVTCMVALSTAQYSATATTVDVETESSLCRGTTIADFKGHWNREHGVSLVTDIDIAQAHEELARVIKALGKILAMR